MTRPIRTLLIANRGEIAVRIIRTARSMGIRTVAVFSDADTDALHVAMADEALRIGPAPARASYLAIEAMIDAACVSGADAIHPGYGFLAENADFAEACLAAGVIFVGPPAAAIRAMGSKADARRLMQAAGVPVVPGYDGADQGIETLEAAAVAIGFPLLVKPSAGGGGKGMRVVGSATEFRDALASAKREALSAFGDDRMILEKYLGQPRHVEVQVFAARTGRTVHLFERDCSIQRRHQKVIEEAPAPGLSEPLRRELRNAAIACARAVDYVGAGTVEFLVTKDQFFFMEMNTRLQVEHPVTEAITGLDLVEWQIRVARGEDLPRAQDEIAMRGHAVEARLSTEDPEAGFLPQTGRLDHLRFPVELDGVRIDTGVRQGDDVSIHYDPLIAKVIAHGSDRSEAIGRLRAALAGTEIVGLKTNRGLLSEIVAHPAFAQGSIDTGFIEAHQADLFGRADHLDERILLLAAFAALRAQERSTAVDAADPFSPWGEPTGWRLGEPATLRVTLAIGERTMTLEGACRADGYVFDTPTGHVAVTGTVAADGAILARIGDRLVHAHGVIIGERMTLFVDGHEAAFELVDPRRPASELAVAPGRLTSPMPGLVVAVTAAAGQTVVKGAPLVIVEAMKMEHAVTAPRDGRIRAVKVAIGDQVAAGAELVVMEDAA
ncbi:MAG: acetyl/propionyl/methylcrotonyl-CoA carboxylase subunit alpha [Candidatus Kaistia colombiensis]|nr:MAG: acetyl/propionyl/methylcrotonyl-CoA carboxylase subunit alpha [Kaistia sp.]